MKRVPEPLPSALPSESVFKHDGAEETLFATVSEAVRDYVDQHQYTLSLRGCVAMCHWPLVLEEYRHVPKPSAESHLQQLMEAWHDDFGNPDEAPPTPTPGMLTAMQTILDGLTVFICEETGRTFLVTKEDALRLLNLDQEAMP